MKKSVLIGIIIGAVVLVAVFFGVVLGISQNNCKHDDPTQIVTVQRVPATCQETGLTSGKKCNKCGTMVEPQTVIKIRDCIESDWIVDDEATHTKDGKRHTECTMCGVLCKEESIPSGNKLLEYTLLDNNTYEVSGIGQCRDNDIVIPSEYDGLPVTRIGDNAFMNCHSLASLVIPDSITSIGVQAISHCFSLTTITIPKSVTSICEGAFLASVSLKSIVVDENNPSYKSIDGNLYTKDGKTLVQYAVGKQDSTFSIPNFVTSIGGYAFFAADSLTSVIIPDSVTSIGKGAFYECLSLTSITIPDGVTNIEVQTFSKCQALKNVTIPSSVTKIGISAFEHCWTLENIYFEGTQAQWDNISKGSNWNTYTGSYTIYCSD